MTDPRISIIVLSYNKLDYTRRCLQSYLNSSHQSFEIIVVDNGSDDGSLEWLREFSGSTPVDVKIIANTENRGCSTARNQGRDLARGTYLVFTDNDMVLRQRNWLELLEGVLENDEKCGVVGPKILYPFDHYPIQCAGCWVSPDGRVGFRGRGEDRDHFSEAQEVQALISACYMVRATGFDEIGGFNEIYNPVEYEDIELCYALRELGYSVRYEPSVEIYHFENVTTEGTVGLPNMYLLIKNSMIFKKRWHHMFVAEAGEPAQKWQEILPRRLDEIGSLEIL